jgi:serine/threonine protein kinase
MHHDHKLETLFYMAPERLPPDGPQKYYLPTIDGPSKESDVYSLAMTSYEVCSYVMNQPAI